MQRVSLAAAWAAGVLALPDEDIQNYQYLDNKLDFLPSTNTNPVSVHSIYSFLPRLACSENPCQNKGICFDLREDDYYCNCQVQYAGANCEINREQEFIDVAVSATGTMTNCHVFLDLNGDGKAQVGDHIAETNAKGIAQIRNPYYAGTTFGEGKAGDYCYKGYQQGSGLMIDVGSGSAISFDASLLGSLESDCQYGNDKVTAFTRIVFDPTRNHNVNHCRDANTGTQVYLAMRAPLGSKALNALTTVASSLHEKSVSVYSYKQASDILVHSLGLRTAVLNTGLQLTTVFNVSLPDSSDTTKFPVARESASLYVSLASIAAFLYMPPENYSSSFLGCDKDDVNPGRSGETPICYASRNAYEDAIDSYTETLDDMSQSNMRLNLWEETVADRVMASAGSAVASSYTDESLVAFGQYLSILGLDMRLVDAEGRRRSTSECGGYAVLYTYGRVVASEQYRLAIHDLAVGEISPTTFSEATSLHLIEYTEAENNHIRCDPETDSSLFQFYNASELPDIDLYGYETISTKTTLKFDQVAGNFVSIAKILGLPSFLSLKIENYTVVSPGRIDVVVELSGFVPVAREIGTVGQVVVYFNGGSEYSLAGFFDINTITPSTPYAGPYHWVNSVWGACSLECGKGYQTRTVECADENQQAVHTWFCNHTAPPPRYGDCDSGSCTWAVSRFDECPAKCGNNVYQTRTVQCSSYSLPDSYHTVSDAGYCDDLPKPNAKASYVCNSAQCPDTAVYGWNVGEFGPCSTPCGGKGIRQRSVVCENRTLYNVDPVLSYVEVVDDSFCSEPKADEIHLCTEGECLWTSGPYGACDKSCKLDSAPTGYRHRSVRCIADSLGGAERPGSFCSGPSPNASTVCDIYHNDCEYGLLNEVPGEWSTCEYSAAYNETIHTRETRKVSCDVNQDYKSAFGIFNASSGDYCGKLPTVKYKTIRSCQGRPIAVWTPWNTSSCDGNSGFMTRSLTCVVELEGKVIDPAAHISWCGEAQNTSALQCDPAITEWLSSPATFTSVTSSATTTQASNATTTQASSATTTQASNATTTQASNATTTQASSATTTDGSAATTSGKIPVLTSECFSLDGFRNALESCDAADGVTVAQGSIFSCKFQSPVLLNMSSCATPPAMAFASNIEIPSVPSYVTYTYDSSNDLFEFYIQATLRTDAVNDVIVFELTMDVPNSVAGQPRQVVVASNMNITVTPITKVAEKSVVLQGITMPVESTQLFIDTVAQSLGLFSADLVLVELEMNSVRRTTAGTVTGLHLACNGESENFDRCNSQIIGLKDDATQLANVEEALKSNGLMAEDATLTAQVTSTFVKSSSGLSAGAIVGIMFAVVVVVGVVGLSAFFVRRSGGDEYRPDDDGSYDEGRNDKGTFDEDDIEAMEEDETDEKKHDLNDDEKADSDSDSGDTETKKTAPPYERPPDYKMVKEYLA